jgi:hypothetical protein
MIKTVILRVKEVKEQDYFLRLTWYTRAQERRACFEMTVLFVSIKRVLEKLLISLFIW